MEKIIKSRIRTKILCTVGPSSSSEAVLREMMKAGMDAVRINFSHGGHKEHLERIETIRLLNKKYRRGIRILADLEGARIRVGRLGGRGQMLLEKNKTIYLSAGEPAAGDKCIPFDYEGELSDIEPAEFVYIDDGNIVLRIEDIEKRRIRLKVVSGGMLKERKGINIPGAKLKFPLLCDKDKKDIDLALESRVDYIAQSFVRSRHDITALREYIGGGRVPKIVAKIECQQGINNIEEIIKVSDGIMIARGDMGISIPVQRVPFVQKEIIKHCRKHGRFSITATQMLESMVENPFPTRAEVSDVANAVLDGTDFVMLSAETSVGKHPVACVRMMNSIIKYAEQYKPA
ncbi:MAG: pyruvate kinase [Candidatus Omnitrophica bacterium]|nr:pyruvate kinase [Candidatus Omnitrophota bacterium]